MNKNTTFLKLIQTFLSEAEIQSVLQEFGYKVMHGALSLTGFQRLLLCDALPLEWIIIIREVTEKHRLIYSGSV